MNYRKLAFDTYLPICAYCGFGIREILEVAHLDGNRNNNTVKNLVILCPNCHKMHDIDLIPTATVILMRNRKKHVDWNKRLKDAATKSALTRKRSRAGKKAAATRAKRLSGGSAEK